MKRILYGTIVAVLPNPEGGFTLNTLTPLAAGVTYDQQISSDNGATWTTYGTASRPANLPPQVIFNLPGTIQSVGGNLFRLVEH